ncbi:hypothetical protein [Erythrobacter sp. SAORIC-644]|uniref:hypothetical protein n=1 Tax=Erythrobacter sp. SAORIC-644 TaxID=1869314 RepID=UPI0011AF9E67|nr:hypothetical protein [Erythrobacter sp. SAORIC-644]
MARTFLVEVKPYNNATNQRVTVRLSKAGTHGVVIDGSAYQWHPLVTQIPTVSYLLQSRNGVGGFDTGYGPLGLTYPYGHKLDDGTDFDTLKTYDWDGAECKVWMGDNEADFSTFTQILEGRCGPLSSERTQATIVFRGPAADLDKDLLSKSYGGSGGAEGRADIKGVLKPWCSGVALNITPRLLDPLQQVYQYHGYGPTQGVTAVYENAVRLKPATAVVSTYAQLVALTLAEDEWAVAPPVGMFRLGGEPVGLITADVVGATDGAAVPKRAGAVCAHLMKAQAGITASKLSSATALDNAFQHDLAGFYVTEQMTVADAVKQILEGINGYVIPDGQANWIFGRNQNTKTPTYVDRSRSTLPLIRPNTLKQMDGPTRAYKVRVGSDRNWTPQSNISDAVREAQRDIQAASNVAAEAFQDAQELIARADEAAADGKLVGVEKKDLFRSLSEFSAEKSSLEAQANDLGIATEKDDYIAKYNALNTYFNSMTPPLVDYSEPTTIVRATLLQKLADFTNARTALLVRISRRASEVGNAEIYDPMVYATAADFNAFWGAAPSTQIVTTTSIGGRAIQVGDNAGNDVVNIAPNQWLNYHSEDLYEVKFELEVVAADPSAKMYLGVEAQDNNGQNLGQTYNYVAVSNGTMSASLGKKTYTGYFRGLTGATTSGTSNDRANPVAMPSGTVRIRPRIWIGYPSNAHRTIIHSVQLRKIEDATLSFTGAWSSSRSYFVNEAVTYSGRTFSSKTNGNINNTPPSTATSNTHWTLVADRGEDGIQGEDGAPGFRTMLVPLYRRAATAPARPTVTTYWKFATNPPTLQGSLNGWSVTQPSSNGQPLWTTQATASCLATEDTAPIDASAWSTPTLLVQDGAPGAPGAPGPAGPAGPSGNEAVTPILKPPAMTLPSYANGLSPNFSGASTTVQLLAGGTDVSSSFTLSIVSNPQNLTTSISGRTITVTGAGTASGQFGNANVTNASLTIRATGSGAYAGRTFDQVFHLGKIKGGYEILGSLPTSNLFEGRMVFRTSDNKLYTYTGSAWVSSIDSATPIPGGQLVAGSVLTNALGAGVVTAAKTNITELSAITADMGTIRAGQIIFNHAGFMRVQGIGFGSNSQFFEWFGPSQSSINNCTEANAITYLKTNGDAYFGGTLSAGIIRNSARSTQVSADASASTGQFASNGRQRVVVVSYTSNRNVSISGACNGSGSPSATIRLKRNGAVVATWSTSGNVSCEPGFGVEEPGRWNEQMGTAWTYTDNSGGTSIEYTVEIVSRTLSTIPSTPRGQVSHFQSIGVISTEE